MAFLILRNTSARCMNKLGLRNADPIGRSAEHIYPTEDVYDVWREFIFMVKNFRGPFTTTSSDDVLGDTAAKFARLFPEGPPRRKEIWYMHPGSDPKSYVDCIKILIGRIPPIPIKSRWYSYLGI